MGALKASRDPVKRRLLSLHVALLARFGPQRWWPARGPFEVAVGAILTQHTAWSAAARAVGNLRSARALTAARLAALSAPRLQRLVRPAGTYRLKARRLRGFTAWLLARHAGRMAALEGEPLARLRGELLALPGIGPETADSILLYGAGRPVFVADAYSRRVLARHRLVAPDIGYEDLRRFLEAHLPGDPRLFNELHALLVAVGKSHCGARPRCGGCPLSGDLRGRRPRG
ncbi:MAG: endonuclease III domain-containing protein [Candidatus Rokubacteria bacterium]|nr:endonuclease III domain-containing protein [Candidatus Rokubacteria bacterium]